MLADENRLEILEFLFNGPANVSTISSKLKIGQSLLSHHLKIMKDEGLLAATRNGKTIVYEIAEGVKGSKSKKILDMKCCRIDLT
ncbi:MAG: metalloregulator ArsR/SmtB family transcription factor [Nitrospinota bacterium]|nr:metalloregulator ArsR/SmtB family transcription factor [Nitrospinota bacterium]